LAQGRLSLLLALEVAPTGRATADRYEVVTPGIGLGLRHLEAGVGGDACVRGRLARAIDPSA
jgi:hypothetical protein